MNKDDFEKFLTEHGEWTRHDVNKASLGHNLTAPIIFHKYHRKKIDCPDCGNKCSNLRRKNITRRKDEWIETCTQCKNVLNRTKCDSPVDWDSCVSQSTAGPEKTLQIQEHQSEHIAKIEIVGNSVLTWYQYDRESRESGSQD